MANALGDVTKSQVQRLYEQGMPKHSAEAARAWRLQNLELSRTADSRIDRPQASAQNVSVPAPPADEPDDAPDQADENTSAYRADRARNERIKADRAEMELQQLRGELVPARAVADMQYTVARIVRDRLLMVPGRAATDLHALAISLVPEEHRAAVAKALPAHTLERRLEDEIRAALDDAAKASAQAGRDDDDDDAD
jgi:hypothetical protein